MHTRIGLCLLVLALLISPASAQNCATFPNPLANGTVADATKVMGNFTYLGGCAASMASPAFTGTVSIVGGGASTALTVSAPSTTTTGTFVGLNLTGAQSVTNAGTYYGFQVAPTFTASGSISSFDATNIVPQNTGGGSISNMLGEAVAPSSTGSSNVTYMKGVFSAPSQSGSGLVQYMYGVEAEPSLNGSSSTPTAVVTGIHSLPSVGSSATGAGVTTMYGVSSTPEAVGVAPVTSMFGVSGVPEANGASASVTTMYALYGNCSNLVSGGSVTTCYEMYLGTPTGTINHIYGIYQTYSSAVNYIAGNVGIGTSAPSQALEVNGEVKVDSFGSATATAVCENGGVLSSCSSSLRYKENVKDALFGLDDVLKMRPVTFKWKGRDENDFGLVAEDVAKIDPLFVTYKDGKIEGVKYPQLTAVLVGAIKELKTANDAQAQEIGQLRNEVGQLQKTQTAQTAGRQELSTLRSENAFLKARLDGIDARLDDLETRHRIHSALRSGRLLHLASRKGG